MKSVSSSFSQYLNKTENTQQLSDWISHNTSTKIDALKQATRIAFEYNKYQSDLQTYGVLEKFATPDEVLKKGTGDCDCKSGLIVSVLDGLPLELKPDETRVTVGRFISFPPNPREYHAWAEARIGDRWYILDGTSGKVIPTPTPRYMREFSIYPDKVTMAEPISELANVAFGLPLIPILEMIDALEK